MKPRANKAGGGKFSAERNTEMISVDPRVQRVARAIERGQFQSIPELAQLVKLSGSRLSHLFKEQTGQNLKDLLVRRRLERAAHLLRSTNMPISEISQCVGYHHAPSFVRAFRRIFNFSPSVYRIRETLSRKHSRPR